MSGLIERSRMLRREFLLAYLNERRARRALLKLRSRDVYIRWEDMHAVLVAAAHEFYRHMTRQGAW